MAILWMDGFDHYGIGATSGDPAYTNMIAGPYSSIAGSGTLNVNAAAARTGPYGLYMDGIGCIRRPVSNPYILGVSYAFYATSLFGAGYQNGFNIYNETGTYAPATLSIGSDGSISLANIGAGGSYGTSASGVVTVGAWHYIEGLFDIAAQTARVQVDGVDVLNLTGVPYSVGAFAGSISFRTLGLSGARTYADDVVVWDTTGAINNTFLGDRRVATLYPDGDTITASWLLNGASTGYECINQTTPDGDATYISALSTDPLPESSAFTLQNLPSGVAIVSAVQTVTMMKKTDTGPATVSTDIVSGTSVTTGASKPVTPTYQYYEDVFETDPATGVAWTPSGVNGAKVNIRRVT